MKLLEQLYKISSPSRQEKVMIKFILKQLNRMGVKYTIDKSGNIYATKGISGTYPCIVSHTDEVHRTHPKGFQILTVAENLIFGYDPNSRQHVGIGADDKNGIWICLKCLEEFDVLKCAFFVSEEIGCIGSSVADMLFFSDCRFVLQCDRRGYSDIVTKANMTELCSRNFLQDVCAINFGYKEVDGMLTDVVMLKDKGLNISCVNISCGYYYPHSEHEFTNIKDLIRCLDLVKYIIVNCRRVYKHEKVSRKQFNLGIPSSRSYFFGLRREPDRRTNSFVVEYDNMQDELAALLRYHRELTIDEIMNRIGIKYPQMTVREYENAYLEITGSLPSKSFSKHSDESK
ncbi:hypothetical protein [Dysgonomonas sp. ZJ709]|uniref:hypothetical protein n=1 Tax=Dysgonomonas sp. ZJ709 TaxID=2709797 RepID=UPI0016250492|nr:hypothetical protein [Dysgonomonas sp. ZJ709]